MHHSTMYDEIPILSFAVRKVDLQPAQAYCGSPSVLLVESARPAGPGLSHNQ